MKINRSERTQFGVLAMTVVIAFVVFCFFVTFMININENKGVIPIIFILIAFYTISKLGYNEAYSGINSEYKNNRAFNSTVSLLFFFINVFLFGLSFIVLWK